MAHSKHQSSGSSKANRVEVNKGPVSLKEQDSYQSMGRPEKVMKDIVMAEERRSGMHMTFHTPNQ
jgi:hypothetical protein